MAEAAIKESNMKNPLNFKLHILDSKLGQKYSVLQLFIAEASFLY